MSMKLLGVNLAEVPSTTAMHELGLTVEDPRGGQGTTTYTWYPNGQATVTTVTYNYSPGSCFKYCKALGTITAGDSVKLDVTATQAERFASVIRTAAVDESIEGVALASATTGQYLWVQIGGNYKSANVATAAAAGDVLGGSATAGRLATATASAANAYATACGRGIRATSAGSSNTADIIIY